MLSNIGHGPTCLIAVAFFHNCYKQFVKDGGAMAFYGEYSGSKCQISGFPNPQSITLHLTKMKSCYKFV
jgi:hypothetical protein